MKYEAYMEEYVDLVKRFTEAQDKYNKLMDEQVDRNRQSIKLQAFINEIKATDALNLEFNDLILYINTISTINVETPYKSLIFAVFIPIKEKNSQYSRISYT